MALMQKLLTRFNGLGYRQEYLCLAKESFLQPLHVYVVENEKVILDVTHEHQFVGYCPLIFTLPFNLDHNFTSPILQLRFSPIPFQQNEILREKDAIATLVLKKIQQQHIDPAIVSFYEGIKGSHHFLSRFHQLVLLLNNKWYGKKRGNVFLENNLYKQVQIGYAVPRQIGLITVGQNNFYNLFPTDLHGQINEDYYVVSLRHEGKACKQVESSGKIVLSEMDVNSYRGVYLLGKNHMQQLKDKSAFSFSEQLSHQFYLPLPIDAVSYQELEAISSFIHGIHKLILFKTVYVGKIDSNSSTLAHVHSCYATWRNRQGIEGNYLLR